jgi:hypothetical protein
MPDEADLTAALRTLERHAPDSAALLSAVRESATQGRPAPGRTPAGTRRWPRLVRPLAAAVSVLAILAVSLVITSGKQHVPPAARGGAAAGRGAAAAALAAVPPYYLSIDSSSYPQRAAIRATATGKVVLPVALPAPFNSVAEVTAAADDRTFVLLAQQVRARGTGHNQRLTYLGPRKFVLLRFSAAPPAARLIVLPIAAQPARAPVSGIALSPDATKLAVAIRGSGPGEIQNAQIQVFSVATGADRTWTWPGAGPITNNGEGQVLSWAADGRTIAFQQWMGNSIYIRLLDIASPGSSLKASRLAVAYVNQALQAKWIHNKIINMPMGFNDLITPDGTKIVAATVSEARPPVTADLAFTEFSTSTGRPVAVLGRWHLAGDTGQTQDVLWTDASGRTLIVIAHQPGSRQVRYPGAAAGNRMIDYRLVLGIQRGNHFTQLPDSFMTGPFSYPVW